MTAPASNSTALATRAPSGVVAAIHAARRRIEPFLPEGVSIDRVAAGVYLATKQTPQLLQCAPESLILAVARIQSWGLEVGVTAHLLPFGKKCEAVADYKGLAELMIASGAVRAVEARCVYEGDEFEYEQGLNPTLRHLPMFKGGERGALLGAYAILRLPHGQAVFEFMPLEDIDAIRHAHSKQWAKGPCPGWYAKKTVVRQVSKLVPKNPRLAATMRKLEEIDATEGVIDVPFTVSDDEAPSPEHHAAVADADGVATEDELREDADMIRAETVEPGELALGVNSKPRRNAVREGR